MYPLRCCVKKYEWGRKGMDSAVARMVKNQIPEYVVDDDSPHAELWMGTHPSGPTMIVSSDPELDGKTLLNLLQTYPEYVGTVNIVNKYGDNLPFLFKVLSVGTALSIQAHPNKKLAEELHRTDPFHYPDANHKPEMAITLTDFEAMCGFRPHAEIEAFLDNVPEFRAVIGNEATTNYKNASDKKQGLKQLFVTLMSAPETVVIQNLEALVQRWSREETIDPDKEALRQLFLKLYSQFPNDIGCFAIFYLNYLKLKPGEAIYLGQDEPHAYIVGDCMECMACSDNVVRAGLTPKFKDVKTLSNMLTYISKSAKEQIFEPKIVDEFTKSFVVPVPEFVVDEIRVDESHVSLAFEYTVTKKESGSILIVIRGEASCNGTQLTPGYVGFIPAVTALTINQLKSPLLIYRAYCRTD
ncbi:mannose-6-phosphate isomerase-like [Oppia nitens]|uniref:mannose-6-phosphate isomerase-like n=1 Tax=Oppia nitens TaxID=1686743 RepID=UPI0023DC847D|nr:mannose-6-phosphate isomerase-like [Oppia nitens]